MTHLAREKAKADAEYYKAERQAEAYKVRLRGTNLSLHSRLLSLLVSIWLLVFSVFMSIFTPRALRS